MQKLLPDLQLQKRIIGRIRTNSLLIKFMDIKLKRKILCGAALIVVLLVVIDQITKIYSTGLKDSAGIAVISGVFELYYLENTGTAWGMFAGARIMFLILTVLVLALAIYVLVKMPATKRYIPLYISLILLAAGGIGNFIDRLILGYVRDFLYFKLIDFPVFNVADSYVTVGLVLLILLILFVYKEKDFNFLPFIKEDDNEQQ